MKTLTLILFLSLNAMGQDTTTTKGWAIDTTYHPVDVPLNPIPLTLSDLKAYLADSGKIILRIEDRMVLARESDINPPNYLTWKIISETTYTHRTPTLQGWADWMEGRKK